MKVSKRDFLKLLTAGGSVAALGATPRNPAAPPETLPTKWTGDEAEHLITREHALERTHQFFNGPAYFDAVDGTLYDRIRFKPGQVIPQRLYFFSTPLGQICPHSGKLKGFSETNLSTGQMLPAPNSFWAQRVHVITNPDVTVSDYRLTTKYAWRFWIMQKRYAGGPLWMDAQKAKWTDVLRRKTRPARASMEFPHCKGLYIGCQMNFYAEMSTESPLQATQKDGNGVEFAIALEGIEFRGVQ